MSLVSVPLRVSFSTEVAPPFRSQRQMPESLTGIVERITFHSPESGFSVLRVKVKGQPELVTVVGSATSVSCGEILEAQGDWIIDRQFGQQFKAEQLSTSHPASVAGIQRFLGSGAVRSVGPKIAERIVERFGDQALEVLDQKPSLLLDVHGIGESRLSRMRESWREQKEVRKITLFLSEYDISSAKALRIYRTYGGRAIARIKENPYQLANDIRGIGFKTADELAGKLGIAKDSPFRIEAGVQYTLQQLSSEGHCAYPAEEVHQKAAELLGVDADATETAASRAIEQRLLIRETVDGREMLYLAALHQSEVLLAKSIGQLTQNAELPLAEIDIEKAIPWVQETLGIELAAQQETAIREAMMAKMLVVTGGPGVGKTTLVRSLLEIFRAKRKQCILAAPTGRAAKRLAETTGQEAKTIHRLLEFDPVRGEFKRHAKNPLEGDLFVIDESSMLDLVLAQQLMRAIPEKASVVWVGDVDQLPSVGPGCVLNDLIKSELVPVVRLTEVFRQARESKIISAAYEINQGLVPDLTSPENDVSDFYFIEAEDPEKIRRLLVKVIKERIPQRFSMDPMSEIQVLAPMNRSELGARNLNVVLQEALNGEGGQAEVERYGWRFRVGDRVIQNENNYDRDVYNGDLGLIEKINRVEQTMTVKMDGRLVEYDFGDLDELSLAYVMSIHKSQGSEFPGVVIPLHTQHFMMLQRNLLYTAVTRGKQLVVLIGSRKALEMSVQRADSGARWTTLSRRLREYL